MSEFNAKKARTKHALPMWVDSFLRKTMTLSIEHVGAYNLILFAMWSRQSCDLPSDDDQIARVCRVSKTVWLRKFKPILWEFFEEEEGVLFSKRLKKEAQFVEKYLKSQSDRKRGKVSGKSLKTNDPVTSDDVSTDESPEYPTQQPNNPTLKIDTNVSIGISSDHPTPANEVSQAVVEYNSAADQVGWPKVQKTTPSRSKQIKARLKECGGVDGWRVAIEKATASDFLCGRTSNPWTGFGFDWLIKSQNFTKLMEGNYDNRTGNTGARGPNGARGGIGSGTADAFAQVAAELERDRGYGNG